MTQILARCVKLLLLGLLIAVQSDRVFAYPDCSTNISSTAGPCGVNASLTLESSASIIGDTTGVANSITRHFTLSNPGSSTEVLIYGAVTNNVAGNRGIGFWQYPSATLTRLLVGSTGSINGASDGYGIYNDGGSIETLTNRGVITASGGWGLYNASSSARINMLENTGTISGSQYAIKNEGVILNLVNSGLLAASPSDANSVGISNNLTIGSLVNSGTISGQSKGLGNAGGSIASIFNSGTISARGADSASNAAIYVSSQASGGSIGTITNTGSLIGTSAGIRNVNGSVATLNNAQGAGNPNGALTYAGILPIQYNIIVNSPGQYGQLAGVGVSGATQFGIYPGSVLSKGVYPAVLTGLTPNVNVNETSGMFEGTAWSLVLNAGNRWDLVVQNSARNTLQALQINADALSALYDQQAAAYQAAFSYDCQVYDAQDMCMAVGGRLSSVDGADSSHAETGWVLLGYRPLPTLRFGVFVDQAIHVGAPTGLAQSNSSPMWGAFAKWNMNPNGSGLGVQLSTATSFSTLSVTRPQLTNTEIGTGETAFDGLGAQLLGDYVQPLSDSLALIPYLGLRYIHLDNEAYSEQTSATVTSPLSYREMAQHHVSVVGGIGVKSRLTEKLSGTAAIGFQHSLLYSMSNYRGSSSITGLEQFSLRLPNANHAMASVKLGLSYELSQRERLGLNLLWQQQAFADANTTTLLASYSIGF